MSRTVWRADQRLAVENRHHSITGISGAFPQAPVVGNPVREDILSLPSPAERFAGREGPVRILVIGGSQGARILNQTLPEVAGLWGCSLYPPPGRQRQCGKHTSAV